MIRKLNIILLITCGLAFTGVYVLKFSIEHTASERLALMRHINEQQETLSLLQADWAVLTQPGHIAPIIARHQETLQLALVGPRQFGSFETLPMRPARPSPPDAAALDELFQMIEAGIDPIGALLEEIE